ncbi:MAG: aromatic ring-hydroxylating dioxygenase subunit alpha [Planctomycetaceae bacterium]|nr:aromatic ring-hydroxylating dioxygenase subunit alpha [Planctomycetaceae bacterium]
MFVSETHLPQLLSVSHYTDPAFHQRELDAMFLGGWHCVAVTDQLPKVGDFLTIELHGRPLIVWRTDSGIKTFLNVCTHRFSTLTDKPHGSCPGHLKCQYHGWEYDGDGNTCKIPDAQSFRPLKKGELGLREYRTETVGQLIFVTLSADAPPVREYLGNEMVALCERWFSPQHRLTLVSDLDLACNWKIVVENVLESYHIACVHAKSFAEYPQAEHCTHAFHPTYDHYIHDFTDEPRYAKPERTVAWFVGREPDYQWHHLLRYPHLVLGGAGPHHYLQMIWPTGPTTCRSRWITTHDSGPRGSWWAFLMHRCLLRWGQYVSKQVQREDALIYPSVHRGTATVDRPHGGGLISAREERIFAFQEAVLRGTGEPLPLRDVPANARPSTLPVV